MDPSAQSPALSQPAQPVVAPTDVAVHDELAPEPTAPAETSSATAQPTTPPQGQPATPQPDHPVPVDQSVVAQAQPQANPVADASSQPQPTTTPELVSAPAPSSSGHKEAEPIAVQTESVPLVELKEDHELEPDVEGWLEKVERTSEVATPAPVQDDQGNVVLADASAQVIDDKIVLPMTEEQAARGIKAKVTDSARWLAAWCGRIIKKFGNQVQYASQETKEQE